MDKKLPEEVLAYFRRKGREGGLLSKDARMKKLTAAQRKKYARKAAAASAAARRKPNTKPNTTRKDKTK